MNSDFNLNDADIHAFVSAYTQDSDLARSALRSTAAKMARWVRGRAQRQLPAELRMKASVVRRRLRSLGARSTGTGAEATVFMGMNPVAYRWLDPKKTAGGVSTRAGSAKGAFFGKTPKGTAQVFRRQGKQRLPLTVVKAEVAQQMSSFADELFSDGEFENKFYEILERELKWRT